MPRIPARVKSHQVPAIVDPPLIPVRPVTVPAREIPPLPSLAHLLLKVQQLRKADVGNLEVCGADAVALEAVLVGLEVVVAVFVEAVLVCCFALASG